MGNKKIEVAILPLEDALLFPNTILPMHVYEQSYVELVDFAMTSTKKIAITFKKPGFETEPLDGTICCVGNITYSEDALLENNEGKAVVVSGTERAKVVNVLQTEPFIKAEVEIIGETCSSQTEFNRCKEALQKKLIQFLFLRNVPDRDIHLANLIVDPGHIADFVAYYFIDDMYLKMSFLETIDVAERCKRVSDLLDQTINALTHKL